jgi:Protein of unknown function (DUF2844)
MVYRTCKCALFLLVVGTNPLATSLAYAGLGGDSASVNADAADLHGVVSAEDFSHYTAQQITGQSGMRIREFLNENGIVFAVTWTGPVLPDLRRLMGARFADYATALAALRHPGLQRSLRIAMPDLIVESGGHLRAYSGRAYLPALIPSDVSLSELH